MVGHFFGKRNLYFLPPSCLKNVSVPLTTYVQHAGENASRQNLLSFPMKKSELNIFPFQLENWILPCKKGGKKYRGKFFVGSAHPWL